MNMTITMGYLQRMDWYGHLLMKMGLVDGLGKQMVLIPSLFPEQINLV